MRLVRRLIEVYATADPRSLAAGRIALALVLLIDLLKRGSELTAWYTNQGLLPNHTLLWRPTFHWVFSFFYMASWPAEAALGFIACGLAYLALLVGFRTRLAAVASVACVLSLHGRVLFVQNGGDVVLSELCLWMALLPTGRRFSVDSLLARLRARREQDPAALADRAAAPPDGRAVVSLGVAAVLLQLTFIYLFNAIHKSGPTWRAGTVVHYVLQQDRIVTNLGVWAREHLPQWSFRLMTWNALAFEGLLPLLLLLPLKTPWVRRGAIAVVWALHLGFAAFLNLGVFVPAMLAFTPNLIPARDWDALERWWARRRQRRRTVLYDAGCGICFQVARVLSRLDRAGHLELLPNDAPGRLPAGVDPTVADTSIVVVDPATGRHWLGAEAVSQIARSLPLGFPVAALLWIPGVHFLAERAYAAFARRRTRISEVLGLAACGRPHVGPAIAAGQASEPPWRMGARARLPYLREGLVLLLIIIASSQMLTENWAVRRVVSLKQPPVAAMAVSYLQLFQGWAMFAPDAPAGEMNIYVDAVTADGRHVDPLNEVASPGHPNPGPSIPPHLDQDSFFTDYISRIEARGEYHTAFIEWLLRYPERTGHAQDRIVSLEAFVVEDDSPPPGEKEPRNVRVRSFLKHVERVK